MIEIEEILGSSPAQYSVLPLPMGNDGPALAVRLPFRYGATKFLAANKTGENFQGKSPDI